MSEDGRDHGGPGPAEGVGAGGDDRGAASRRVVMAGKRGKIFATVPDDDHIGVLLAEGGMGAGVAEFPGS
jgi:hypothetical protein